MLNTLSSWTSQHPHLLFGIVSVSLALLLGTLLATPWILARLPENYFLNQPERKPKTVASLLLSIARTGLGFAMMLLGILMFFTPGPGLVMLILGVAVCDLPGKYRLQSWLVRQPSVFKTLSWLRARANKPPFILPPT